MRRVIEPILAGADELKCSEEDGRRTELERVKEAAVGVNGAAINLDAAGSAR